jgi:type IV secretion system protein VirB11
MSDINQQMNSVAGTNAAALLQWLRPIQPFLEDERITEICINRPFEVFTESNGEWSRYRIDILTMDYCLKLVTLIATYSKQKTGDEHALLSASLPGGERVQTVIPPACEPGTLSITIRKPSMVQYSLEDFEKRGFFDEIIEHVDELMPFELELMKLKKERRFREFFDLAVRSQRNIVIAGKTGSGKTTFGKAITQSIPRHERIITIEDVRELFLPKHPNKVHLLYSKDNQGLSKASSKQLLQSCLRMRPDRILLAEIRGEEAYDYLVNVGSGHPGSITTVHAGSAKEAFEMLMMRVKESPQGMTIDRSDIIHLLRCNVDIIVQLHVIDGKRKITEVYYEPQYKRKYSQLDENKSE